MTLRARIADLPLLVVCVLLLSTAADILPNDTIVGVGEVQLNLARLLLLAGLAAFVIAHGLRVSHWRAGIGLPLLLLLGVSLYSSHKWGTYPRFRFLLEAVVAFYLTFAVTRIRGEARDALVTVGLVALAIASLTAVAQVAQSVHTGFYRDGCKPLTLTPGIDPPSGSLTRATGTFANPNVLAGYLLLLLPIGAMASVYVTRLRGLWAAVALGGGLGFLSLVFTFSRAAVLMSLVALALGILISDLKSRRWLLLVVVLLAVAIGVLAGSCGSDATAGYGRSEEWSATMKVIGDYPDWGVGLGRLGFVLHARDPASSAQHAHNLFLTWWAEAGTGALVAWIWIFAALVWRSLRGALRTGSVAARVGLVALVGFLGMSMLDHPANVDRVALAFWIVAGFAAASGDPARSWLRRRRGDGAEPLTAAIKGEHAASLADRPRSGNVKPLPRE